MLRIKEIVSLAAYRIKEMGSRFYCIWPQGSTSDRLMSGTKLPLRLVSWLLRSEVYAVLPTGMGKHTETRHHTLAMAASSG